MCEKTCMFARLTFLRSPLLEFISEDVMLLATNLTRRPAGISDLSAGRRQQLKERDGIELDSLEVSSSDVEMDESGYGENSGLKRLNLNGLCKDRKDNNYYTEDLIIPEGSIQSLLDLQVLSLRSNALHVFPTCILQLTSLICLDLADNNLLTIPTEIGQLVNLEELVLDQNVLSVLPPTLWELKFFRSLRIAYNRLALPPDKFADMGAFVLAETEKVPEAVSKTNVLTNLNLRANRLKGNIILGNYGNLTDLDVSENSIENLDLSAVEHLKTLQCSKNSITLLTLHGKTLTSLLAGNNRLKNFVIISVPTNLRHVDVSYNELETLPDWIASCQELRSLFASNNCLKSLPDHLFCSEMPYLHTLQLAYNQLHHLPVMQRKIPLREFFLQNNSLSTLPEDFFKCVRNIKVLNVSNNRLCELPKAEQILCLEKLFVTANCLTSSTLEKTSTFLRNLKILHAAYNNFTTLSEACTSHWAEIEEIVLSGNKLVRLPENIGSLTHLAVLRVHSNLLQTCPALSNLSSLRVLDLAHNHLDKVNLVALIPPNLKFLDLSCNSKLHVDSQQFHTYRSQRPMSLVDVSGKNRTSLPLTPSPFCESDLTESSWTVGFSETAGSKQRLYISQIRLPAFCNTEALFGMFDGENNGDIPVAIDKIVPRILLEERTVKETAADYMKYTMLSTHKELRDKGQRQQGMNAVIVHILKSKVAAEYSFCGSGGTRRYVMKIASVGDMHVVLGRTVGPVKLLPSRQKKRTRANPRADSVPDPEIVEVQLEDKDEYMIVANRNLWDVMSPENAIREVSLQRNVILAAKRLQDLAQSYGAEENLSVIVVRFNLIGSDVDLLMKELRQTIKKNKYQSESGISNASTCQVGCCCEILGSGCAACLEKIPIPPPMMSNNDDRSSPSGQSDHACSDCNSSAKMFIHHLSKQNDNNRSLRSLASSHYETAEVKASPERRSYRGVAKALRARKEEADKNRDDSDSALSEEQFKCWEYMLEQNTQLLFDKELNTLTRGARSRPQFSIIKNPPLSRSSPHLAENGSSNGQPPAPFLSRQFGSTRSFNPLTTRPMSRFVPEKKQLLGGPHAAYFGSLQRLMPYNLEYDFAVMQERGLADSLDLDRMQQYWGVTTTEL